MTTKKIWPLKTTFSGVLEDYRQAAINTFYMPNGQNDENLPTAKVRVVEIYQSCPDDQKPGLFLILETTMGRHESLRDSGERQEKSVARLNNWLQYLGKILVRELTAPPEEESQKKFARCLKLVAGISKVIRRAEDAKTN